MNDPVTGFDVDADDLDTITLTVDAPPVTFSLFPWTEGSEAIFTRLEAIIFPRDTMVEQDLAEHITRFSEQCVDGSGREYAESIIGRGKHREWSGLL